MIQINVIRDWDFAASQALEKVRFTAAILTEQTVSSSDSDFDVAVLDELATTHTHGEVDNLDISCGGTRSQHTSTHAFHRCTCLFELNFAKGCLDGRHVVVFVVVTLLLLLLRRSRGFPFGLLCRFCGLFSLPFLCHLDKMFSSLSFLGCALRRDHFTELLRIHLAIA